MPVFDTAFAPAGAETSAATMSRMVMWATVAQSVASLPRKTRTALARQANKVKRQRSG